MQKSTQILLIEDDDIYAAMVNDYFCRHPSQYKLELTRARNVDEAVATAATQDFKIVIVDLALPNGELGTESIDRIWAIDKKVIFIIHSILEIEELHGWFSDHALPYTSRFYLQKTGLNETQMPDDARRLFDLVLRAIKCYVPHFEPTIISVQDTTDVIDSFWLKNKSFNRSPIVANLHYSQDLINEVSRWASDKLSRSGFDTERTCGVVVGSLARLEAGRASDADYFFVFDDRGLNSEDLDQIFSTTYRQFIQLGQWFENFGISAHGYDAAQRKPENIVWHTTTLPTWFPLSTLTGKKLGIDTQLELSKLWFLMEGCPIFNKALFAEIHSLICDDMRLSFSRTTRDNVIHSDLKTALSLLSEDFRKRLRRRTGGEDLIAIKNAFFRSIHILANRLFLLQCYLDDELYNQSGTFLITGLRRHPLVKLIEFHDFAARRKTFGSRRSVNYKRLITNLCNCYADGLRKLNDPAIRSEASGVAGSSENREIVNDLMRSAADCESRIEELLRALQADPVMDEHNDLQRFWR